MYSTGIIKPCNQSGSAAQVSASGFASAVPSGVVSGSFAPLKNSTPKGTEVLPMSMSTTSAFPADSSAAASQPEWYARCTPQESPFPVHSTSTIPNFCFVGRNLPAASSGSAPKSSKTSEASSTTHQSAAATESASESDSQQKKPRQSTRHTSLPLCLLIRRRSQAKNLRHAARHTSLQLLLVRRRSRAKHPRGMQHGTSLPAKLHPYLSRRPSAVMVSWTNLGPSADGGLRITL
ncbi:hypothetical protein DFH07DRAFT_816471 [Mycena maculata]|uniref:Uncharacterized protein n=1 Tax=Mycena maculata TaxID=230809 RepID=A0AAD7JAH5_9AGAR|nr:hypothetical protein DFH07DRAFT_816471 [Mycena maculata]